MDCRSLQTGLERDCTKKEPNMEKIVEMYGICDNKLVALRIH